MAVGARPSVAAWIPRARVPTAPQPRHVDRRDMLHVAAGARPQGEVHLFAPDRNDLHVELLTALGHYHRTGARVGLGDTVNFGRPWLPGSTCTHGLLSLPYLDGPGVEWLHLADGACVRFLWLVPITAEELAYKKKHGVDALEACFERAGLNYLDANRHSVASS
jgi:hypothetical protein